MSIPNDPTFVKNTLVWNGLAFIIAFGKSPCLSRNFKNLTATLISPVGIKPRVLANLSVSLLASTSLFCSIIASSFCLISKIVL